MADSTEADFLAAYQPGDFARPSVTVDLVVFTVLDTDLKVLLVRRGEHPFRDLWALPGGFVGVGDGTQRDPGESLDRAAARELGEECFGGDTQVIDRLLGQRLVHLEQLYTFGAPLRDPRGRVITVAYTALVPPDLVPLVQASTDAREARFWSVAHELPELAAGDGRVLAFDHDAILDVGVRRLRGKIDYAPVAFHLLPARFTVTELRSVHEAIKGTTYDRGNFRRRFKRMLTDGVLRQAPGRRLTGGKPAKVYELVWGEREAGEYVAG